LDPATHHAITNPRDGAIGMIGVGNGDPKQGGWAMVTQVRAQRDRGLHGVSGAFPDVDAIADLKSLHEFLGHVSEPCGLLLQQLVQIAVRVGIEGVVYEFIARLVNHPFVGPHDTHAAVQRQVGESVSQAVDQAIDPRGIEAEEAGLLDARISLQKPELTIVAEAFKPAQQVLVVDRNRRRGLG
jgi:hypothetical protein